MSVIDYLNRLVNQIGQAINLAVQIVTTLITSGWYVVVRDAAVIVPDIDHLLNDPTCGQEAQCTKLDTILSDLASLASDIAALGAPQQTGVPVTLPTVPPPGYGVDSSALVTAIWQFIPVNTGRYPEAQEIMAELANLLASYKGEVTLPTSQGDLFVANANYGGTNPYPFTGVPFVDVATIRLSDPDAATWLNREEFHYSTWAMDATTGLAFVVDASAGATYYCTVNQDQLRWYGRENANKNVTIVPPVWPGIANVTLGTPRAIAAPGELVVGNCDGVIIAITAVPPWAGNFSFGTAISWRNVGAVTFTSDNGDQEFAQTFSWSSGVYLTKSQQRAAGYAYRAAVGVSGTITPFTLN